VQAKEHARYNEVVLGFLSVRSHDSDGLAAKNIGIEMGGLKVLAKLTLNEGSCYGREFPMRTGSHDSDQSRNECCTCT
jgi:hypothetical protein